jgi:hypothetical protein
VRGLGNEHPGVSRIVFLCSFPNSGKTRCFLYTSAMYSYGLHCYAMSPPRAVIVDTGDVSKDLLELRIVRHDHSKFRTRD